MAPILPAASLGSASAVLGPKPRTQRSRPTVRRGTAAVRYRFCRGLMDSREKPGAGWSPATTADEAADRLRAAGLRIKEPTRHALPPAADLPALIPWLLQDRLHGQASIG